ncbi:SURF1 family protein [uncultured Microbacterium sp.]|uniref:SURF1 family protein n=1 Tax=uncultured Microbacterium sp. TaxID=191216 RepID=UPI0035C95AD6
MTGTTSSGTTGPVVFPPTLREVLLRPRWLGMLALCLVVAGVFAWLGQWQLGRALQTDPTPPGATEQVEPIADVVAPGAYLPEPLVGQRVTVSGTWVPDDFLVVASRFNNGTEGYWVTGQLRVVPDAGSTGPTSIAVAIGWAPSLDVAHAAIDRLQQDASAAGASSQPFDVVGRIISDEGPALPRHDIDPQTMTSMSPAALLGQWHDVDGLSVYRPYLASQTAPQPLADIASPPPPTGSTVNWLNIFYAVEWAVFAGFAFYLWYRLGKDAWEREVEDIEDAAAAASPPRPA